MDNHIDSKKYSDILKISLEPDEELFVKESSIISKNLCIRESKEKENPSVLRKLKPKPNEKPIKKLISKERSGVITLSPPYIGEIKSISPTGDSLHVFKNSFLCASPDYTLSNISEEIIILSGSDKDIFVSSFGSLIELSLKSEEQVHIVEDYLVAKDSNITIKMPRKDSITPDDSRLVTVQGEGKVYHSTRSINQLRKLIV